MKRRRARVRIHIPKDLSYAKQLTPSAQVTDKQIANLFVSLMNNPTISAAVTTHIDDEGYRLLQAYKEKLLARHVKRTGLKRFMRRYPVVPYLGGGGIHERH